jgi:hypothetical protein
LRESNMVANRKHLLFVLIAMSLVCALSATALAQCATCGAQTVAYQPVAYQAYSPVAYQAYSPVAYTTSYSGWYPGYWFDRVNRAVWGAPATTTVAYAPATYTAGYVPATYTAGYAPATTYAAYYQPTYAVGYAPVSTCSTCAAPTCSTCAAPACSTCSASYAPACSTCSTCTASYAPTCTTCAMPTTVSEVVLRPVCDSCSGCSTCGSCSSCSSCGGSCPSCSSGSGCSSCGAAPVVTQAVYEQPASGCSSCGAGQPAPVTTVAPSTYANPAPSTYRLEPQPTLAPAQSAPPQSTFRETQKPEPAPATDSAPILQPTPQKGPMDGSSTNLEAPKLLSPQDRTAQRNPAPVWTAVYNKPASGKTAIQTVSRQQAVDDASGWVSASK